MAGRTLILVVAGLAAAGCSLYFGDDDDGAVPGFACCDDIADPDAGADPIVPECASPQPGAVSGPGECDPVAQTGCATDHKCTITAFGIPGCVAGGVKRPGEPCTTVPDTCRAGSFCTTETVGAPTGVCREVCVPSHGDCSCGTSCSYTAPFETYDFGVCAPACDPIAQDCGGERACYLDQVGNTSCVDPWQTRGQSEPCPILQSCAPGFTCWGTQCTGLCDASAGAQDPCASGYRCQSAGVDPEHYGVCVRGD